MKAATLETLHPEAVQFFPIYQKTTDCTDGQNAIKNGGTKYLPKLTGQKKDRKNGDTMYQQYLDYAVYFGGVGRTVDGYMGLAFRKAPVFTGELDGFETDVTGDGEPLDTFARKLMRDVIVSYRPGILVDVPALDTDRSYTVAEAAVLARPFFSLYLAASIYDWREERVNGQIKTTFVKLFETEHRPKKDNPFEYEKIDRVRILSLTDENVYRQTVYEKTESAEEYALISEIEPVINGSKLDYIPFVPCSPEGVEWALDYPVINDLSDVSLAHYRNSASYQNGLLMSGCPTLCVAGLLPESKNENDEVVVGASSVMQFDTDGKWGFAEIGTNGLAEIRLSMDRFEKQMSILGSRILQADRAAIESADAAAIHRSGENGVLGNICNAVSSAITEALRIVAEWTGANPDSVSYEINTDFEDSRLQPAEIQTLMQGLQSGLISKETFFHNLSRGEVYPTGWTFEQEAEAIERDMTESFGVSDQRYTELLQRIEAVQPNAGAAE